MNDTLTMNDCCSEWTIRKKDVIGVGLSEEKWMDDNDVKITYSLTVVLGNSRIHMRNSADEKVVKDLYAVLKALVEENSGA